MTDQLAAEPGRWAIIADDLTGALDSAAQLLPWGQQTLVVLAESGAVGGDNRSLAGAPCVAVTTDSRACPPAEACLRTRASAARWTGRALYLKIDSTLRGSVGAIIDGCLDGSRQRHALIAPSFPAAGRTVKDGELWVDAVALAESPFRAELGGARTSQLPLLLARHTRRSVSLLPLAVVERGPEAVGAALAATRTALVVADATSDEHLRCLALGLAAAGPGWLACGSAGLAAFWPLALGARPSPAPTVSWPSSSLPVLLVCGSRNPTTLAQVDLARASGMTVVEVEPHQRDVSLPCRLAIDSLGAGRDTLLGVARVPYRRGEEELTALRLAECTRCVVDSTRDKLSGLFLTGGDLAYSVCRGLDATALQVVGEVVTGVPLSILRGGPLDGLRVVTKAGGFGQPDIMLTSCQVLRGGTGSAKELLS